MATVRSKAACPIFSPVHVRAGHQEARKAGRALPARLAGLLFQRGKGKPRHARRIRHDDGSVRLRPGSWCPPGSHGTVPLRHRRERRDHGHNSLRPKVPCRDHPPRPSGRAHPDGAEVSGKWRSEGALADLFHQIGVCARSKLSVRPRFALAGSLGESIFPSGA